MSAAEKHTRKERETIDRAFARLSYLCDSLDWTAPAMLREALKNERKARTNITTARALIVRTAATDYMASPASLYGLASGLQSAAILGGGLSERKAEEFQTWVREYATPAVEAHGIFLRRYLDSI